jgi:acyl dehydratase
VGLDLSLVGSATEPFVVEVTKADIRRFAEALGDTNPLYHDEEFARRQGYAGLVAPPTFSVSFRPPVRQSWMRGLDDGRILAGEQSFKFERPVIAGDVLTCRLHFLGVEEKEGKSGRMQFINQEMRALDPQRKLVVTNVRMTIYRAARVSTEAK